MIAVDLPRAPPAPAPRPWSVLALTSLPIFTVALDTTILYVAFGDMRASFAGASDATLSWVLNAYTVVFGALLVVAGRFADRVGRRRAFTGGLALFTAASALCGVAPSPALLIAARVAQAVGAAALLPTSLALVLVAFPRAQRPVAVGVWAAVQALAAAVGPALGSAIVQSAGWRWAFYVNVPIGLVAIARARGRLDESREAHPGAMPGPWPVGLAIGAPGLFALAIIGAGAWGPGSRATLGCLGAGLVVLALLVHDARSGRVPIIDRALFRDRNYRVASWATLVFSIAFSAMFFGLILFLTRVWGYSVLRAGLAMTPGPLAVVPVALLAGRRAARRGHRELLVAGGLAYAAAGLALLLFAPAAPAYLRVFLPASLVIGAAIGLVLPSLSAVAVHGLPPERLALGVAVNSAVRQVGSVLGVAFVVATAARAAAQPFAGFRALLVLLTAGGVLTAWIGAGAATRPTEARGGGGEA